MVCRNEVYHLYLEILLVMHPLSFSKRNQYHNKYKEQIKFHSCYDTCLQQQSTDKMDV